MAKNSLNKIKALFRDLFVGKKKLTPKEIWHEKRRICASAGIHPKDVKNFWEGIEELRWKICIDCGAKLSALSQKISEGLKANYGLCSKCNPHSKNPF
jgi:hypothetical protein